MNGRMPEVVEIRVGRNSQTGTVSLSSVSELITLTVSYKGERASSVMLTPEQVRTQLAGMSGSYVDVVTHRAPFVMMAQTFYFAFFFFAAAAFSALLFRFTSLPWAFL